MRVLKDNIEFRGNPEAVKRFRHYEGAWDLYMEILKERVRLNKRKGHVTVIREIDGDKLSLTQKKAKSKYIHVEIINE